LIHELPKEDFPKVGYLLGDFSHYLVLPALLEGRTRGRIWVNDLEEPTTALVWDKLNAFFYLAGNSSDSVLNQELNSLIEDTIYPEVIQLQYNNFFLQFAPQTWDTQVEVILKGSLPEKRFVNFYRLDTSHSNTVLLNEAIKPPAGYEMTRITDELLSHTDIENLAEVAYCIQACWQSTDHYLNNGGIGYCLLKQEAIASWCSTDYVVGNTCEMYIETFEGHKEKGLGTLTASACIQACIARGFTVHWHCFKDNLGSVKIAEKIGFSKIAECPIYVVRRQKRQIYKIAH
jgi:RimJ/RimL family protein N-acetyltransferase